MRGWNPHQPAMTGRHVLLLVLFVAVQAADGALTFAGVQRFGITSEANVLIATAMHTWGALPALVGAKLLAASCGLLLFAFSVHRVLAAAAGAHLAFAVIPWLVALLHF